jgi:hypothetical protein
MQPPNRLALHEARLVALRERLVRTLGIHTARVLLDRALWQTAQRHPALALVHHDEAGFSFEALEQTYATRPQEEVEGYATRPQEDIEAALTNLSAEMLRILERLLGGEMARRMDTGHPGSRQTGAYWG